MSLTEPTRCSRTDSCRPPSHLHSSPLALRQRSILDHFASSLRPPFLPDLISPTEFSTLLHPLSSITSDRSPPVFPTSPRMEPHGGAAQPHPRSFKVSRVLPLALAIVDNSPTPYLRTHSTLPSLPSAARRPCQLPRPRLDSSPLFMRGPRTSSHARAGAGRGESAPRAKRDPL